MSDKNKEFLKANENAISYDINRKLYERGYISIEEHIKNIKTYETIQKIKAEEEYKKIRNKNIAHAVIDIGTAAIPAVKGVKIASKIAEKMVPVIGKKLSAALANGVINGAKNGAIHGALSNSVDGKNPLTGAIKEGAGGAIAGGAMSYGAGKLIQKGAGKELHAINDIKALRKAEASYYKNYIQGRSTKLGGFGTMQYTKAGLETVSKRMDAGRNLDTLMQDIKKSKYIKPEPPAHPRRDDIVQFHRFENKNQEFLIAESKDGGKKYYMSSFKNGAETRSSRNGTAPLDGFETRPSRGGTAPSNLSITQQKANFNPLKPLNNQNVEKAFSGLTDKTTQNYTYKTLEGGSWTEDFHKNFLEGFDTNKFTNPENYPYKYTESKNEGKKSKTKTSKGTKSEEGHWVTLKNGNHVFIED